MKHFHSKLTIGFALVVLTLVSAHTAVADVELVERRLRRANVLSTNIEVGVGTLSCAVPHRGRARANPRVLFGPRGRLIPVVRSLNLYRRSLRRQGLSRVEIRAEMRNQPRARALRRLCNQLRLHGTGDSTENPNSERTSDNCISADLNNDGVVDTADLLLLLQSWGPRPRTPAADLNEDGVVNHLDLHMLFRLWGEVRGCDTPITDTPKKDDGSGEPPSNPSNPSAPGGDDSIDFDAFGIVPPYDPSMECGDIPGSRIYHISQEGNDAWSGLLPEPNASLTDGPKRSLDQVGNILRNQAQPGDCVLLRRGDIWLDHEQSGSAIGLGSVQGTEEAPIILGAYGPTHLDKPTLDIAGAGTIISVNGSSRYLVIRDLKLTTTAAPGQGRPKGVGVIQCAGDNRPEHIVFDSMEIVGLSYGLTFQSNHLTLKNSLIQRNYKVYPEEQSMGHTQGLFVGRQCGGGKHIHVLNNVFESNGARQTWFDWNAYIGCSYCTFIGNHVSNPLLDWEPTANDGAGGWVSAGSAGFKIRKPYNMIVRDNTFTGMNSVGLSVGSDGGTFVGENILIERNIISDTIDGITVRTQSSGAGPMRNLFIRNNLFFSNRPRSGANYNGYLHVQSVNHYYTRIENNTFFDIRYKSAINVHTLGTPVDNAIADDIVIRNNLIHMSDDEITALRVRGSLDSVTVDGNLYDYPGQFLRRDNYVDADGVTQPRQFFNTLADAQLAHPSLEPNGQEGSAGLEFRESIRGLLPRLEADSDAIGAGSCGEGLTEDFFRNERPSSHCTLGAEEIE